MKTKQKKRNCSIVQENWDQAAEFLGPSFGFMQFKTDFNQIKLIYFYFSFELGSFMSN